MTAEQYLRARLLILKQEDRADTSHITDATHVRRGRIVELTHALAAIGELA